MTIHGGEVTALGYSKGAGIGGGNGGAGGTVTIYGGTVTTSGDGQGKGIGAGHNGTGNGKLTLGAGMYLYGGTSANPENDTSNHVAKAENDYARSQYMTVNNSSPHSHDFTYTENGAVITATCANSDQEHIGDTTSTLTIVKPTLTTYGGTGSETATLSGLAAFNSATGLNVEATDIKYVGREGTSYNESATAPTNAGKYTAKITITGVKTSEGDDKSVTACVDYEISRIAPAANDFTYTAPSDLAYDGTAKVYSGIAALPTGFKIVAEWKDSNNTSKTKELTVSEATGSGTASSPYVWTITDLPINTEVTFTESGYTVDGYKISVKVNDVAVAENKEKTGNATAVADPDTEARGSLVFENNYVKSFEFTKVWRDAVGTNRFDWPEGKAITVVILQSTGDNSSAITNTYASYTITKNDLVENREISAKNTETDDLPKLKVISISDSKYGFRLEGLPAGERGEDSFVTYIYSVKEDPAVEGYQSPKYYMGDTVQHGDSVKDGGTIANDIISYELPQTGGIGTTLFTALGGLMTVAAGAVLTLKSWRRRKQNT